MSRTSKALKRLGVAGVVVATIGAGVPAFFATAASAAGPTTQLTISPVAQTGASGTCLIYTVTPTDSAGAVPTDTQGQTIQLTASSTSANEVEFCNPTPNFPISGSKSTTVGAVRTPASTTASPATTGTAAANAGTQTFGIRGLGTGGATIRAFVDRTPGVTGQFDAGEPTGTATATFTAGGLNETDTSAGGNSAQDAVKTITEVAQSASANPVAAGNTSASDQFATVQLKNSNGDTVSGVQVSAQFASGSANGAQAATATTTAQPAQTITCVGGGTTTDTNGVTTFNPGPSTTATGSQGGGTVSNNNGVVSCSYRAVRAGTDTLQIWVNQTTGNTSGPDAGEPQISITRTTATAPNQTVAEARNIDLTPEGPINTVSGQSRVFTATVTDGTGAHVQGVQVTFSKTGGGNLAGGTPNVVANTNAFGQASVTLTSVAGETGQAVVTSTITSGGTQCGNAAGTPTSTFTAGNCSDSEVTNFVASSPSASPSASASPSNSPSSGGRGTLSTSTPDIQPNIQGILTASGLTSNAAYELRCYSRPSTTYFTARSATTSATATTLEFRILPGSNTRCYVRPAGNESLASNSVVINVHTTLSLSTVRTGVRTYIFQGRNLPRRAGQLITLYRVNAAGQEIRTSNLTTDASGIYRVTRTFTGNGTFQFKVRTSQTLNNAAGVSNTITVTVH
jgi:hypothetical protein